MINRPIFFVSLVALLWAGLSTSMAHAQAPARSNGDRVVAIVNNEAITRLELNARIENVKRQAEAQKAPLPENRVLEQQVLERMINDRIQLQYAKDVGVDVSADDLNAAISRIAESNRTSVADFRARLAKEGVPWERFRADLRDEFIIARLRDQEVDRRVPVSDAEVDSALSDPQLANELNTQKVMQTRARHILIKTDKLVSDDDARHRLQDLRQRLAHGADFAQIARQYSGDASAGKGGDLGWLFPGDTVPQFESAMNTLKPGEVSAPVRSPFGWHLIEVLERRTDVVPADRRRTRVRAILREQKAEAAQAEWLRSLRDRAYVEIRLDY